MVKKKKKREERYDKIDKNKEGDFNKYWVYVGKGEKNMSKKIVKIFMVMLLLISTVQFLNVFDVSAKSVKFSGVYKKNS